MKRIRNVLAPLLILSIVLAVLLIAVPVVAVPTNDFAQVETTMTSLAPDSGQTLVPSSVVILPVEDTGPIAVTLYESRGVILLTATSVLAIALVLLMLLHKREIAGIAETFKA